MPINLDKVSLTKGETINLSKGATFADININLNWSQGAVKKSFFGFGGGSASSIDLDVGCLFELQNGNKSAVQALGDAFGSYKSEPYIELMGDDRSGSNADGETIRINGAQWGKIKRVLVYAFIYEGAANWSQTDGVVVVTVSGQAPVEVRMDNGDNSKRTCAVVLLENDNGSVKISNAVAYYGDQQKMDVAHSWGLNWGRGSK